MNCEFPNMKTIKITCSLCVALLSSIIQDGKSSSEKHPNAPVFETRDKVDDIIRKGGTIKNIFKPLQCLGFGSFGVSYKGELGPSKKMVAMKISPNSIALGDTVNEYQIYTYLGAINNETVENYGIPAVYYYDPDWEGCTLLALTLLEPQFTQLINTPYIRLDDLDILIILREFVRITKYIHSHGVCHGDMHLNNMMFRKNQGFIIDFNLSKMTNLGFGPYPDCRKQDWKRFLYELCFLCGFPFDRPPYTYTLRNIENMKNNDGLRFVLMNFAEECFKMNNVEPINYNQIHGIISEVIHIRGVPEPALVSWLTDDQKNEARRAV